MVFKGHRNVKSSKVSVICHKLSYFCPLYKCKITKTEYQSEQGPGTVGKKRLLKYYSNIYPNPESIKRNFWRPFQVKTKSSEKLHCGFLCSYSTCIAVEILRMLWTEENCIDEAHMAMHQFCGEDLFNWNVLFPKVLES